MPIRAALAVPHLATPSSVGHVEFNVYYDSGTPAAMKRRLQAAGFRRVVVLVPVRLLQTGVAALPARRGLWRRHPAVAASLLATYMIVEATK